MIDNKHIRVVKLNKEFCEKGAAMKKSKKIIGIVLSLIFIIGTLTTVFIATANTKETDVVISVESSELSTAQSTTVSVKVTTNYPVATMSIPVFYDKTLVEVSDATATLTDYSVNSAITDIQSADSSKVYANTGMDSEKFGFVLVNYIGGAGEDVSETLDSVVLTFKITAKTDVSGTAAIKCVNESAKTDDNVAGTLYFGSTVTGRTINSIPENIENIDITKAQANVSIVTGGPTIIANKDLTGVVDNENNYVYGVDAGITEEDLAGYFTVTNGSFEIVANDAGYKNGTGATLVVKDNDGNEVAHYTLVIFGDVNGDAVINSTDITELTLFTQNAVALVDAAYFAANVNGDASSNSTDITEITLFTQNVVSLSVNPYKK